MDNQKLSERLSAPPDCAECNGKGYAELINGWERPCDACHGKGYVMERAIEDALIIQTMALEYFKAMRGGSFTLDEAFEAALATWGTEWDDDPAPRTIESGIEAVHQDLAYWGEE